MHIWLHAITAHFLSIFILPLWPQAKKIRSEEVTRILKLKLESLCIFEISVILIVQRGLCTTKVLHREIRSIYIAKSRSKRPLVTSKRDDTSVQRMTYTQKVTRRQILNESGLLVTKDIICRQIKEKGVIVQYKIRSHQLSLYVKELN